MCGLLQLRWGRLQCLWLHSAGSVDGKLIWSLPYAVVTQVVPKIYVTSMYQRNTETEGNLLQLCSSRYPSLYKLTLNKLNLSSQTGVSMPDHFPSLMLEILFERWSASCRASGSFSRQHRSFPLWCVIAPSVDSWHLYSWAFQSDLFENVKCSHENTIRARFPLKHFCSVIINSFNVSCKRNLKRSFIVVLLFMLNQGKKMLVQVMCLLLVQHSLFCETSQVLFSIHMVKLRDDWRSFIYSSWLNQGQSQNARGENPSVLQSHTLKSSEMLQGLFFFLQTL